MTNTRQKEIYLSELRGICEDYVKCWWSPTQWYTSDNLEQERNSICLRISLMLKADSPEPANKFLILLDKSSVWDYVDGTKKKEIVGINYQRIYKWLQKMGYNIITDVDGITI